VRQAYGESRKPPSLALHPFPLVEAEAVEGVYHKSVELAEGCWRELSIADNVYMKQI
jgi:hypothetical protein